MSKALPKSSYKPYLITWFVLLVISLVMILVDNVSAWRTVILSFLIVAMLVKASLIGANFMHLRSERLGLVIIVAVGILATGAIMFFLMAVDGVRIMNLSHH